MAKNLSATKRVQIALRNNRCNKKYKSSIKTLLKKILAEIETLSSGKDYASKARLQLLTSKAYSRIDKAVKKGVIHKNNAARRKSKVANKIKVF